MTRREKTVNDLKAYLLKRATEAIVLYVSDKVVLKIIAAYAILIILIIYHTWPSRQWRRNHLQLEWQPP